MSTCACPSDRKTIPSHRRVLVSEPGAVVRDGAMTIRDPSKVHIFDKDCPVHGYWEVDAEGNKIDSN
jgi:hypothetical protein